MTPLRLPAKASKYRAKPTVIDGIRFASQKEARRYGELKLLEKTGAIRGLQLQPRYPLLVASCSLASGAWSQQQVGVYIADFRYEERLGPPEARTWDEVVEDVKGFKTPVYRWKKRHVEAQYGITVQEI